MPLTWGISEFLILMKMARDRPRPLWTVVIGTLVVFWLMWCVNAIVVGFLGHLLKDDEFNGTSAILAALATVGEILLGALVSIEDLLGILIDRAGKTSSN